jgi:iron complex outermembrane receptor protein
MRIKHTLVALTLLSANLAIIDAIALDEDELENYYGSEEFVNIATGISQPLSKAPAVASVITAKEIKRIGARDIDEVLETIPGLHVAKNTIGYNPIYTFRGIYTGFNAQILMLIDGQPLTNLYFGDRNQVWGGMPVEAISRIEVIRGPGSAIYGADAFAGVINIITKAPEEIDGIEMGARSGSFDTQEVWIQFANIGERYRVAGTIEARKFDGHDEKINSDAQSFFDGLTGTTASLAPDSVQLGGEAIDARFEIGIDNFTVKAGAQIRSEGGLGAGITQALDSRGEGASDRYNLILIYDNPEYTDNLGIKFQASTLYSSQEVDKNFVLYPPGSTGPFFKPPGLPIFPTPFPDGVIGTPELYEKHHRINSNLNYSGFLNHTTTFGFGYYYGEVYKTEEKKNFLIDPVTLTPVFPGFPLIDVSDTPFVFLPEDNRENHYAFVQDVWHFANDWELTAGIRYDHYSDFGDTVNPRLALVWSARHNMTVKALYGEAFRAPSFAETRVQSNPAFLGNPGLEPEELKSYELAFNYRPTFNINLDLNLFRYKWQDIIQFEPDPGGTSTAQNSGEQDGHGLEFEAKWDITELVSVLANYSWQKSEDRKTSTDAASSPEQQIYIRAYAELPENFNVTIQVNSVMDRNRAFGDARSDIDDYTTVDLTVRKQLFAGQLELSLLAKNLFDEDAREPSPLAVPVPFIPNDLPLAGRTVFGEIRYKFY